MEYNENLTTMTISLNIDGRNYKLNIPKGDDNKEKLLRDSAKVRNSLIEQKRKNSVGILTDDRDIVVLALLNFVYKTLSNEINVSKKNEQMENSIIELKNLNFKLEEIIESFNKLNSEE
ncbi:MAG: cell division protein ZapA [Bacteroidales bacterium]|nr:cell division protein ZapA [Bacteroidales bacterium]